VQVGRKLNSRARYSHYNHIRASYLSQARGIDSNPRYLHKSIEDRDTSEVQYGSSDLWMALNCRSADKKQEISFPPAVLPGPSRSRTEQMAPYTQIACLIPAPRGLCQNFSFSPAHIRLRNFHVLSKKSSSVVYDASKI